MTNWIIAIAAIANVVVYFLLWKATNRSVNEMKNSAKEMARSVKLQEKTFMVNAIFEMADGVSGFPWRRTAFQKLFPEYWNKVKDALK